MSAGLDLYRTLEDLRVAELEEPRCDCQSLYIQTLQWGVFIQRGEGIGDWGDSVCSVISTIILFCPYIYYSRTAARMLYMTLSRMSFINSLQIVYYTY